MHDVEGLLAILRLAGLESVERAFIATCKHFFFLSFGDFDAGPWPPQNDTRLYQLFRTADPHRSRELSSYFDNALSAPPDAMSIEVSKPAKVYDWRSHKVFTLDIVFLLHQLVSSQAMFMKGLYRTSSSRIVTDVQKPFKTMQPLERCDSFSVTNGGMSAPNRQKEIEVSTRDWTIIRSGLCKRFLPGRARVATLNRRILLLDCV